MKLGYSAATAGLYDLDAVFRFAAELELDFVELNFDTYDFLPAVQTAEEVIELKRATGIEVTLHLPFVDINIASLIPTARKAAVEQMQRGLDYGAAIDAGCAVMHTGHVFLYQPVPRERAFDALEASLTELRSSPIPIALENLAVFEDGLIREAAMLGRISKAAGFGNCLDFGHAHIEAIRPWRQGANWGNDLIRDYINTLGSNILHLHLCNNNGQEDLHTATDKGSIAFEKYSDYLANFKGTICLEVAGGPSEVRRSAKHIRSLISVVA